MYDKTILENGGTFKYVPEFYKNQKICNKAGDNYLHALEFVPEYSKIQKMCDKAVNIYPSTMKFLIECSVTQKVCHKAVNRFFLYSVQFLINIKLKKCATELFLKTLF